MIKGVLYDNILLLRLLLHFAWPFGPFSGHGLPDHLLPIFSLLPVPFLQKINGILPKSSSHLPLTSPPYFLGYENHTSLLRGQPTVVSSGHTIAILLLVASYALMSMRRRRHLRRQFRHPDRSTVLCPTHASTSSDLWP